MDDEKKELPLAITILRFTGLRKIVEILSPPDKQGFCDVRHGDLHFKVYKDFMDPFNDPAKDLLKRKGR